MGGRRDSVSAVGARLDRHWTNQIVVQLREYKTSSKLSPVRTNNTNAGFQAVYPTSLVSESGKSVPNNGGNLKSTNGDKLGCIGANLMDYQTENTKSGYDVCSESDLRAMTSTLHDQLCDLYWKKEATIIDATTNNAIR